MVDVFADLYPEVREVAPAPSLLSALWKNLAAMPAMNRCLRGAEHLHRLSDAELTARGFSREDIYRKTFAELGET